MSKLGFIGLGEMGGPMSASLAASGRAVLAFDLDPAALRASVEEGCEAAASASAVAEACDVVFCMLPSSEAFVALAEEVLLPASRRRFMAVDLGTTVPNEIRRLGAVFEERGAALVDAPVSGGRAGAEERRLRMFVGADRARFLALGPLLAAMGGPEAIFYCGPAGMGSVMKGVNQLKMGLEAAIHLEILAFAQHEGLDPAIIERAFGPAGRLSFGPYPSKVAEGLGCQVGTKFRELPYYLRQAEEGGYELPLTAALHACCEKGEKVVMDDHRPAPSFWHELTKAKVQRESSRP